MTVEFMRYDGGGRSDGRDNRIEEGGYSNTFVVRTLWGQRWTEGKREERRKDKVV